MPQGGGRLSPLSALDLGRVPLFPGERILFWRRKSRGWPWKEAWGWGQFAGARKSWPPSSVSKIFKLMVFCSFVGRRFVRGALGQLWRFNSGRSFMSAEVFYEVIIRERVVSIGFRIYTEIMRIKGECISFNLHYMRLQLLLVLYFISIHTFLVLDFRNNLFNPNNFTVIYWVALIVIFWFCDSFYFILFLLHHPTTNSMIGITLHNTTQKKQEKFKIYK